MSDRRRAPIAEIPKVAGQRIPAAYDAWRYLGPVLDRVHTRYRPGARIAELGCGAGLYSALLSSWGYRVTAVDNDPDAVDVAAETAQVLGNPFDAVLADPTNLPRSWSGRFDLIFSLGLMDRFDRDGAVRLLRDQARVARQVMAVMPTRYTRHGGSCTTDGRIDTLRGWRSIFRDAGLRVDESLVFTEPPTRPARLTRLALPPVVYRTVQRNLTYGMSICVFGSRVTRPSR